MALELYQILTYTGKSASRPLKKKVFAELIGDKGKTQKLQLCTYTSGQDRKIFKQYRQDEFLLVAPDVGELRGIVITYDSGKKGSWFLEDIFVSHSGKKYRAKFRTFVDIPEERALEPYSTRGGVILGPMLKYRGIVNDKYRVSAMVVTDGSVHLKRLSYSTSVNPVIFKSDVPICYYRYHNKEMWRYDFEVQLQPLAQTCYYSINNTRYNFEIPALNEKPNILFGSCNDRAYPYSYKGIEDKNVMWQYMEKLYLRTRYHLLVLGGDQVYADPVLVGSEALHEWFKMKSADKWAASWSEQMQQELECFYFHVYIQCWNQGAMPSMFSKLPTLMMWDDHDIIDGWGSLNPEEHGCPVMQGLFSVAKKMFFLYQLQGEQSNCFQQNGWEGPFSSAVEVTGGVEILLPDARSERHMITHNDSVVFSDRTWLDLETYIKSRPDNIQHLFVVCTTPVSYPHRDLFVKLLDIAHNQLVDDCRDHWPAIIHKVELKRLLDNLFNFLRQRPTSKVTILVGDVHLGAYGTVKVQGEEELMIEQFISSGIAATPPSKMFCKLLGSPAFVQKFENADYLLQVQKLPFGKKFLGAPNFLRLDPSYDLRSYVATWVGMPPRPAKRTCLTEPLPEPVMTWKKIM